MLNSTMLLHYNDYLFIINVLPYHLHTMLQIKQTKRNLIETQNYFI